MTPDGNLLAEIPETLPHELINTLCEYDGVRIERIVSCGHANAPDEWYDQADHEWVILMSGGAVLQWAEGGETVLAPGDYVFIPAGVKHRVDGTLPDEHSIWLAIFFPPQIKR